MKKGNSTDNYVSKKSKKKYLNDMEARYEEIEEDPTKVLLNVEYMCQFAKVLTDALRQGYDVLQLDNGRIMIREIKYTEVMTYLDWDHNRKVFIKRKGI